jgi:hypothetical protein
VNRAGDLVCDAIYGSGEPPANAFEQALRAITEFRSLHAGPLQRVAVNLRYYVHKHTVPGRSWSRSASSGSRRSSTSCGGSRA